MKEEKTKIKKAAVWMDHAEAEIIDPDDSSTETPTIQSSYDGHVRIKGESGSGTRVGHYRSTNNESHLHFRKQNELHAYYQKIAERLKGYDEIYVFGPTTAPDEFHNFLMKEKWFSAKRIVVGHTDYITENQKWEQAKKYFDKP